MGCAKVQSGTGHVGGGQKETILCVVITGSKSMKTLQIV